MYRVLCRTRKFAPKLKLIRFVSASSVEDQLLLRRDEFPSRHIGPRDDDIISMLDTLGFKVCNNSNKIKK